MLKTPVLGLLLVTLFGMSACGDEAPKYPLVQDECTSHDECSTSGEFCKPVCNEVGGYSISDDHECGYQDGAVGAQFVNKCVAVPECNISSETEVTPLMFSGDSLKLRGSLCYGAQQTDRYDSMLDDRSLLFYSITSEATFRFRVSDSGASSGGTGLYPTSKNGAVIGAGSIELDTVDVAQPETVNAIPIEYELKMWVYKLCDEDEECAGTCEAGICSGCVTDDDCAGETPFCAPPPGAVPRICLSAEDVED